MHAGARQQLERRRQLAAARVRLRRPARAVSGSSAPAPGELLAHAARQLVPAVVARRERQAGAHELLERAVARHGVDERRRDERQVRELGRQAAGRRVEARQRVVDERRQRAARAAQVGARGGRLAGQARGGQRGQRRPALARREDRGLLGGARLLAERGRQHRRDLAARERQLLGAEADGAVAGGRADAPGDGACRAPARARRPAARAPARPTTSIAAPSSSCASSTTSERRCGARPRRRPRWPTRLRPGRRRRPSRARRRGPRGPRARRRAAARPRAARARRRARRGRPPPPGRRDGRRAPPPAPTCRSRRARRRDPRGRRRAPRSGAVVGRVPVGGRARLHHTVRATGRSWDGPLRSVESSSPDGIGEIHDSTTTSHRAGRAGGGAAHGGARHGGAARAPRRPRASARRRSPATAASTSGRTAGPSATRISGPGASRSTSTSCRSATSLTAKIQVLGGMFPIYTWPAPGGAGLKLEQCPERGPDAAGGPQPRRLVDDLHLQGRRARPTVGRSSGRRWAWRSPTTPTRTTTPSSAAASITGRVLDEEGKGVGGVRVNIIGPAEALRRHGAERHVQRHRHRRRAATSSRSTRRASASTTAARSPARPARRPSASRPATPRSRSRSSARTRSRARSRTSGTARSPASR